MRLEPFPLQLENVARNQSRNNHSIQLGQISVAGRQARLFQILNEHIVMRCSLLITKNYQLMPTKPKYSGERCQYCVRFMSVLLLGSQYNYGRLVCRLTILENSNLFIADNIGSLKKCPLQRVVHYKEVNFNRIMLIGSQKWCLLERGVRYKACTLQGASTVQRLSLNPYLYSQSISLQTEVVTIIPTFQAKIVSLVDRLVCCRFSTITLLCVALCTAPRPVS